MLAIQSFIHDHPDNWRELLSTAPYNLKISEDDGFVLFKYNQIASDFHEEICKEARGLILDEQDNFKVVRKAFNKFFNLGETYADKIDWETASATSKEDGSLISLWFARDNWHISTNGTINAYNAELQSSAAFPNIKNFGQLFEMAAERINFNWKSLDPNYIYTFELCSPANKVVLNYPEPTLYHILTRSTATLEEVEMDIGVQKPKQYNLSSQKEYEELVSSMDDTHEGIVVRDAMGRRVKIKTLSYFTLHHMANNGAMTLERIVDLILKNDDEEFLAYFVEHRPKFSYIRNVREEILSKIEEIKILSKNYSSKKEIALDNSIPNWEKKFYFNAFDKKENHLELRDWCKLIEMWEVAHNESIE